MSPQIKPFERRAQILGLLARQGPLSVRGLQAILEPPITKRRLQDALHRLREHGVLRTRYKDIFGRSGVFHAIAQKPLARAVAAKYLSVAADDLLQPHFRHTNLLHSEGCAIWAERLRRLFPNSVILREHEFWNDPSVKRKLLLRDDGSDQVPDIIILSHPQDGHGKIAIAVEIERSVKSEKRLVFKLRKYAARTHLDGVIYLCDKADIADRLRLVYTSKVLETALRVRHYGQNFLLLSDGRIDANSNEPVMFNAALQRVSLSDWMRNLAENQIRQRRDATFR